MLFIKRLSPLYEIWKFYSGEDLNFCFAVGTSGVTLLSVCYSDDEGSIFSETLINMSLT